MLPEFKNDGSYPDKVKIIDYHFILTGNGVNPKTGEKIPGSVGLRLEYSDGTERVWAIKFDKAGKNK